MNAALASPAPANANANGPSGPTPGARNIPDLLLTLSGGHILARALHLATSFGIADRLAGGAQSVETLAAAASVNARALRRMLDALCALGIFMKTPEGHYGLTPMSQLLRADTPFSVRDAVLSNGAEFMHKIWSDSLYTLRTGRPACEAEFGMPFFSYLSRHATAAKIFDDGLACFTQHAIPSILRAYDFRAHGSIVDVGGGTGALLAAILEQSPGARGTLFEAPGVIERARPLFESRGLAERCDLVAGDFFERVPEGADAYVLKNVIHDWQDDQAITILRNCRRGMKPESRLLILESIVEPTNPYATVANFSMMVVTGGAERTEAELRSLCAAAQLRVEKISLASTLYSVVEAVAA